MYGPVTCPSTPDPPLLFYFFFTPKCVSLRQPGATANTPAGYPFGYLFCTGIAGIVSGKHSTNEPIERRYFTGNTCIEHVLLSWEEYTVVSHTKSIVRFSKKITRKPGSFIENPWSRYKTTIKLLTSCALVCRDQCSLSSGINPHTSYFAHDDACSTLRLSSPLRLRCIVRAVSHTCPTCQIWKTAIHKYGAVTDNWNFCCGKPKRYKTA